MSILGNRIKKERTNLALTREEFAKKLGVSYSAVAMYEQGNREPSYDLIIKMCELFNCSIDYIIGASDVKLPKGELVTQNIEEYYKNKTNILLRNKYVNEFLKLNLSDVEIKALMKILLNDKDIEDENYITLLNAVFSSLALTHSQNDIDKIKTLIQNFLQEQLDILNEEFEIHRLQKSQQEKAMKEMHFDKLHPYLSPKKDASLEDNANAVLEYLNKHNIDNFSLIPVLGKIAAGQPLLAEEYIEGYLPVDPNIYGLTTSEELFYLLVSGDSMNQKVENGDYVLVHKQDYAEDGDIIVAIVNDDNEATLKRYKEINNQYVQLEPMSNNPIHQTRTIDLKTTKFLIVGKAIGKFGKF